MALWMVSAEPADTTVLWLFVMAGSVLVVLIYAGSCAWFPFRHCPRCEGAGRHTRKDGKVFRSCRRCRGSGRRLRAGRWIYNKLSKVKKDAR